MGLGERLALKASLSLILFTGGIAIAVGLLTQNVPVALLGSGIIFLGLYWFYVRFYRKRKPAHPFGPPDGKPDIYFPRSDIPRPLYEDMWRMQDEKRRVIEEDRSKDEHTD
ncbi:hypothetical protein MUP00_00620 [Candidatus Bathyarchaeota archaeon]|nr:hypothetical protein [Candidatus Bathyarchaeota archaeon]